MNLLPRQSDEPDVNLTPMIDVVFLLLLFFMVSTSFIRESALKVDLPQATGQTQQQQNEPVAIIISADGSILINDMPVVAVNPDSMRAALKNAVGDEANPHIVISADAQSAYQLIVTAMDAAQSLGYDRLTLATQQNLSAP